MMMTGSWKHCDDDLIMETICTNYLAGLKRAWGADNCLAVESASLHNTIAHSVPELLIPSNDIQGRRPG